MNRSPLVCLLSLLLCMSTSLLSAADYASHPPNYPLPTAIDRPMGEGPAYFVDSKLGDDANPGTEAKPFKTVQHGVDQLKPGDTLYLRGGVYYETVLLEKTGSATSPITLRSYPNELAIIDGGLREYVESPATAWEPCPDGVEGEYQSTRTYPDFHHRGEGSNIFGNFADSMVPLQAYRFHIDLQSSNNYWDIGGKFNKENSIYCGPGVWFNPETKRIHCRLAHTDMPWLGESYNYRGETDPRKIGLVLTGETRTPSLTISNAAYITVQDIVVRGSRPMNLHIQRAHNITIDGVTCYGANHAMNISSTTNLRMLNTALRGIAAPWTYRGSLKYRAVEAKLLSTGSWQLRGWESSNFEFAYCEFTDSVDGVFIGNVRDVRVHHSLLENISDDGFYNTAITGYNGKTYGGKHFFYQNRIARTLTSFAFGVGHGRQRTTEYGKQLGDGMWIYRNLFDYREPVMYVWPRDAESHAGYFEATGRMAGDHGSPIWEPMFIYQNTIVAGSNTWRGYYATGVGGMGMSPLTSRLVMNNIIYHTKGKPGLVFQFNQNTDKLKLQADYNLLFSDEVGDATAEEYYAKLHRGSWKRYMEASKANYPPGITANDLYANPQLTAISADWTKPIDAQLQSGSPAIDRGTDLPATLPDPLRTADKGKPDIGMLPADVQPWRIGVRGRMDAFGNAVNSDAITSFEDWSYEQAEPPAPKLIDVKPAAIVMGYPAFDAPLIEFVLNKLDVPYEKFNREWLPASEFHKYSMIAYEGDLARGKVTPREFTAGELRDLQKFLNDGGTLFMSRGMASIFSTQQGMMLLDRLLGNPPRAMVREYEIKLPDHPWVAHLKDTDLEFPWNGMGPISPFASAKGEHIIATDGGRAALMHVRVGKGQIIYIGWTVANALPQGRTRTELEEEIRYEAGFQILRKMISSVYLPDESQ